MTGPAQPTDCKRCAYCGAAPGGCQSLLVIGGRACCDRCDHTRGDNP